MLPASVRPVVLADRGFARAPFFTFLQQQGVDYVVRVNKGTCLTDAREMRTKLSDAGMRPGQVRWLPQVRYGLYHGRPRDLWMNVACCWRMAKRHADERQLERFWHDFRAINQQGNGTGMREIRPPNVFPRHLVSVLDSAWQDEH